MAQVQPSPPTFRATAPLVLVPVSVQDKQGRPVDGLSPADFELLDNGRPRRFDTEERVQPIALAIVIQHSLNSAPLLERVNEIGSMIEPLIIGRRGKAAVIAFSNDVALRLPFTNDAFKLTESVRTLRPYGGRQKQLDAVAEALRLLGSGAPDHRRVILLISESRDAGSEAKLEEVATAAQRGNVSIYTVTFSPTFGALTARPGSAAPPGGMNILALFALLKQQGEKNSAAVLSEMTGGRKFGFLKQQTLESAIAAIGEELHSQYLLTFEPASGDAGQYHRLEVRLKGRPDVLLRARPGYWLE